MSKWIRGTQWQLSFVCLSYDLRADASKLLLASAEAESWTRLSAWLPDRTQRGLEIGTEGQDQECSISFHTLLMSSLGTSASANVRNERNKPLSWYHYPEKWRWGNWDTAAWICLLLDTAEHLAAFVMWHINRANKTQNNNKKRKKNVISMFFWSLFHLLKLT